jgi:DNA-directed RNA polymerase alpha subunit
MNKFTVRPNKSIADIIEVNRNKLPDIDVIITQEEFDNLMPIKVKDLGLSVRASNTLISYGITNIMELVKCSREDILSFDYIGKATAKEIEHNLNLLGLSLPDDRWRHSPAIA